MTDSFAEDRNSFALSDDFEAVAPQQALGLGPLELQYQDLFAEALEDGVITEDERRRLNKAAENLGLNKERLERLEDAMTAAYESHHRVRVVDQTLSAHGSLAPLIDAPPLSAKAPDAQAPPPASLPRSRGPELAMLQKENAALKARVALLEEELRRAQAAVHVEVDLTDLHVAGAPGDDPADVWRRVRRDPSDKVALRELKEAYEAAGHGEGAALVAQALVVLGAADAEETALAERSRPTNLIAPARGFDETLWRGSLHHPEQESTTGAIFALVTPAILVGRVTTLRRDGLLHQPAAEARHEIEESTVMSVRAVGWGAALLGLNSPSVYVQPETDGGYLHATGMPPYSVLGRQVLSGKSMMELAFLVGQHLCLYRGDHFIKTLFSATEDLEDLFLAALLIANPKLPIKGAQRARLEPLARAIEPLLEATQIDTLRGHYMRFAEEGGRTNLMRWSNAVDKTAARVGLALGQDLCLACDLLATQEGPLGPLALDLIAYATSEKFLELRKSLQISGSEESTSS